MQQGGANDAKDRPMNQMSSMLFQYRPYSEQMPLRLSQADVAAVVEAVKVRARHLGHGPRRAATTLA